MYGDITENKSEIIEELLTLIKENKHIKKQAIDIVYNCLKNFEDRNIEYPKIEQTFIDLFNLDDEQMSVCMFAYTIKSFRQFREYLDHELHLDEYEMRYELAEMLGISFQKCKHIIVELKNIGILEGEDNYLSLNYKINEILLDGDVEKLESTFCQSLPETNLDFEKCNIPTEVKNHALSILKNTHNSTQQILLYGAPGTGKTTFAACLAKELGVKAWMVGCNETESTDSRRASLTACIKRAARNGDLVIVDEAESLLDTDISNRYETASTKAWLNVFLEQKGAKIIWITNFIKHIDQSVRRRFSYSIYFSELGEKERRNIWIETAKDLDVIEFISETDIARFAKNYKVQVATIESAIKQAKEISNSDDFIQCIVRYLSAHNSLQNNGKDNKITDKENNNDFNERCVCIEQSLDSFIARCQKIDELMRSNSKKIYPSMGTMLFYGPPGTGKSALALHIAKILNRNYVIRRVIDLVTPYVGETEQNIAEAFAEAEKEEAVLIFDEVDSFLQAREFAHASWEVTQTNEFLTQLEKFKGFCICTTNFCTTMDNASMRRFSFKIAFGYAKASQIQELYKTILEPLSNESMPEELMLALCKEKNLTPGDFHAVRMQFWLDDPNSVYNADMVSALHRECNMKLESNIKCIGF